MAKLNWTNWDRNLKGPSTYEKYNAIAKSSKKHYHRILKFQLLTLLIISILSSIPNSGIQNSHLIQYLILIFIVIYMCIVIIQFRSNHMAKWQKSRFLAESSLSEAWFFLFGFDIYQEGLDKAELAFAKRLKKIKSELKMPEMNIVFEVNKGESDDVLHNEYPKWIVENYNKPIVEKVQFYIDNRIENQRIYYKRRALDNLSNSEMYFYAGLILNAAGIILAIMSIGGTLPSYTYIALFTTLSAATVTWTQTKQYEEISTKSSVALEELDEVKNELTALMASSDELAIKNKIYEAEKLVSREHKVKRASND